MTELAVRRHLQPQAQESLLLCMVALDVPFRFEEFAQATGLADDAIYSSPLLSVPIPRYYGLADGERRWKDVNPAVLWHPLFWLPPRVADRYEIGEGELEDDDTWAVRVALEMTASGMYNHEDGSWVDILHLAGIDITSEGGMARVQGWLAGSPDPVLDAIDLSEYLTVADDPDWAVHSTLAMLSMVRGASASVIAASLHDMVEGDQWYPANKRDLVCRLATSLLPEDAGDMPTPEDDKPTAMLKLAKIATRFEPSFMDLLAMDDGEGPGSDGTNPDDGPDDGNGPDPDSDPDDGPQAEVFTDEAIAEFFDQQSGPPRPNRTARW